MGRHATIRVMGFLVFPLIAYFLFLSIYLVGSWQPDLLTTQVEFNQNTLHQIWISIPVMVFAFSHTPIISTFAIDRREKYGEHAMDKCKKIMKVAYLIICISVLFFVFSCLLSIPFLRILKRLKKKGLPFYRRFLCCRTPQHGCQFPGLLSQ